MASGGMASRTQGLGKMAGKSVRFFSGQSQGLALSSQARVHCFLEAVNSVTLDRGTRTQNRSLSPDDSLFGFLLGFFWF